MKIITLLLITCGLLRANIINVPIDIETISGAVDSANAGDTILVAEGAYYESETINVFQNLYIKSILGSNHTSLSVGGSRAFNIYSTSDNFTLEGVQIDNVLYCDGDDDSVQLIDVITDAEIIVSLSDLYLDHFQSTQKITLEASASFSGESYYQFNDINITGNNEDIINYTTPGSYPWYAWVFYFNIRNSTLNTGIDGYVLNKAVNTPEQSIFFDALDSSYVKGKIYQYQVNSFIANYTVFDNCDFWLGSNLSTYFEIELKNCVIYKTDIIANYSSSAIMSHSIIWANSAIEFPNSNSIEWSYTLNPPSSGIGNILGDPLFVNAEAHDFRLLPVLSAGT